MNYISKKRRKVIEKIKKRADEGDGRKHPYSTADEILAKNLTLYSRGGKVERSHKKRVGNKVRKNLDKRLMKYKTLEKAMKRINSVYER